MSEKYHLVKSFVPFTFGYKYRVGKWLDRYIDALAEGKILGVKCPDCGRVIVPPRSVCGTCHAKLEEFVEVGPFGELVNFTVGHVKIETGEVKDAGEPYIVGMIKLDGADSLITGLVKGVDPKGLKPGIRLKAVFADEPKGTVKDLAHFTPVE